MRTFSGVWLDKDFFNLPKDLYLCSVYIPHEESVFHDQRALDPYNVIADESAAFQRKGMILYVGDFNSRTGVLREDWDHHKELQRGESEVMTMDSTVYICSVYIPHEESVFHDQRALDPYNVIADESAAFQRKGMILYVGDFNSRTGVLREDWDHHKELQRGESEVMTMDSTGNTNIPLRSNRDKEDNKFGNKLINLCETLGLVILNGRKTGDLSGQYTYHGSRGSSAIDYAVCSLALYKYVQSFLVNKPTWYSDHSQINLKFNTAYTVDWVSSCPEESDVITECYEKYVWNEESKAQFINIMNSDAVIDMISQQDSNFDRQSVNEACEAVTSILKNAANLACEVVKPEASKGARKCSKNDTPYEFREALKNMKKQFNKSVDSYRLRTGDQNRRFTMIKNRKALKKLIYTIERFKQENKIKEIESLEGKDTREFWTKIKKLTGKQTNKSVINPSTWYNYFSKLFSVNSDNADKGFLSYVQEALPKIEKAAESDSGLNAAITLDEVKKVVESLKNNKAAGPDLIKNEMIKHSGKHFHKLLVKLYNHIFMGNEYPEVWKTSTIITSFKSGDASLPTNYRGIAISNALHKVLTKILNKRLSNFMLNNKKWTDYQNGFMEKKRTEDNILILQSLFHKYVRCEDKPIYLAFVDFKKFFDLINRQFLLYKLIKTGITGNLYQTLKKH